MDTMKLIDKYILKKEELDSATLELVKHYEPILTDKINLAKTNADCQALEDYLDKKLKKNYIDSLYGLIWDKRISIDIEREKIHVEKEGKVDTNHTYVCNVCSHSGFDYLFSWVKKDENFLKDTDVNHMWDDYVVCLECGSTDVDEEDD